MKKFLRRLSVTLCALALCLTCAKALSVEEALELLEENYVGEIPAAAYEAETLDELFEIIGDPYTYYMDAVKYEEFNASVEGESTVTGIGATIEYTADGILLTSFLPGSGATAAGLVPGDLIIAIDGIGCVPASDPHRNLIIGAEGTSVTLTIKHKDGSTKDYTIQRKTFQLHNTTVTVENGIGTIDCDSFGSTTVDYFYDGVEKDNKNVDAWVVDLRSNTGGLADAAVGTLGVFAGANSRLYYRLNNGSSFSTYYVADDLTDKPAIVLVNAFSASASEILSGGIRAEQAGIVVGSRTFGKGTAQVVIDKASRPDLFDGDSFKITAFRFYCSDGNTTDKIGVLPTLFVSDEYAEAVAGLLSAKKPTSKDYLTLTLNENVFYLDPAAAKASGLGDALDELLSALPPDAGIIHSTDKGEAVISTEEAVKLYADSPVQRGFSDVADSAYSTAINTLGTYGILNGVGDGNFDPNGTLTRAQLCAMLAQALNVKGKESVLFTDVPEGAWYTADVNAIASLGFVNGLGDGRFDPNGTLTQEQFIAIMGRLTRFLNFHVDDFALALSDEDLAAEQYAPLASWARPSASVLTGCMGNMLYTELGSIDPSAAVTREQAAATLCNVLKTLHVLSY
jgi:C-terminal peptidase prc